VIVPTERREENAARGPESARSHIGRGVLPRSNVARRRAAGAQRARLNATDESLLSEGAATEAAWPRSKTGAGGRPGTETGRTRYDCPPEELWPTRPAYVI